MTIVREDSEFTKWELLEYVKRAYGTQIDGGVFTINSVNNWIQQEALPLAYGGNKIIGVNWYLNEWCIVTVEHLNRNDIEDVYGSLTDFKLTLNKKRAIDVIHPNQKPRKQRTALYYQLAKGANKTKIPGSVLPDDYKYTGIKGNQIKQRKKK